MRLHPRHWHDDIVPVLVDDDVRLLRDVLKLYWREGLDELQANGDWLDILLLPYVRGVDRPHSRIHRPPSVAGVPYILRSVIGWGERPATLEVNVLPSGVAIVDVPYRKARTLLGDDEVLIRHPTRHHVEVALRCLRVTEAGRTRQQHRTAHQTETGTVILNILRTVAAEEVDTLICRPYSVVIDPRHTATCGNVVSGV